MTIHTTYILSGALFLYIYIYIFFHLTYSRWASSLPSCLWSQRIFPSLPGSRLTIFLSRCKFSTLTTRQPMVEFYGYIYIFLRQYHSGFIREQIYIRFSFSLENERADAGQDGRTCLARYRDLIIFSGANGVTG